jgi:hypothetical protein
MGERLGKIVSEVYTIDVTNKIGKVINQVKGKIMRGPTLDFWEGKKPCWEIRSCPEENTRKCPALKYRYLPCWQIEGTYRKRFDYEQGDYGSAVCRRCPVYKRWGHGEPIRVQLHMKVFSNVGMKSESNVKI